MEIQEDLFRTAMHSSWYVTVGFSVSVDGTKTPMFPFVSSD